MTALDEVKIGGLGSSRRRVEEGRFIRGRGRFGCEAVIVEYEPLPPVVNPEQSLTPDAPLIRDDKEGADRQRLLSLGDRRRGRPERAFAQADAVSRLKLHYPRSRPSPIECCGSVADFDPATQKLTVYMTTQAPHIIRAAVALVAELPEHHRPGRVLLRRPAVQVRDRPAALGVRLLRHPARPHHRAGGVPEQRPRAASRTAARSGSPRRCSSRSG